VYVFLSVFLPVWRNKGVHNSKTNDPKVFKLGIGHDTLGYPTSDMVLGLKVKDQR